MDSSLFPTKIWADSRKTAISASLPCALLCLLLAALPAAARPLHGGSTAPSPVRHRTQVHRSRRARPARFSGATSANGAASARISGFNSSARDSARRSSHPAERVLLRRAGYGARHRHAPEPKHFTPANEIASLPLAHYRLAPLLGSHESLVRQNTRGEAEGLERIADDDALAALARDKQLVELPQELGLRVDELLPENRRYCRPWTANFLTDLARAHYARFHSALQINSAVRTVAYQRELLLINGNAAPAEGDIASPHLTGAAVDIGKRELSHSEIGWLRAYLLPLEIAGKIDVEEEFHQACFHITVYNDYTPGPPVLMPAAVHSAHTRHRHSTMLLAARVR